MRLSRRDCLAVGAALPLAAAVRAADIAAGVRRIDARLDALIDPAATPEVLGRGYRWAEGPVWVRRRGWLLFTDVPANTIWRWRPGRGVGLFMRPSGLTGPVPDHVSEAGANGLAIDAAGRLVMADSGSRAVARVDLDTRAKTMLADRFEGRRFNSPNDVAVARSGAIFFTDPPYGLKDPDRSPARELGFEGIYRRDPDGAVHLLDRGRRRPNGIALAPDERTLYVARSDEDEPELLAYPLDARGDVGAPRVLHDMRRWRAAGEPGLPDGMAVDRTGTIWATGPGGVHVLTPGGTLLGIVATGKPVANCCFGGADGATLFMTSSDALVAVRTRTRGW